MYVVVSRISIIGCCIHLDICFRSCRIFVLAFNSPHKLNSNSAIPAGSYGHSINLHQHPNTSVLVAVVSSSNATSVRSDLVHTSSGQNFPTMAQSGGTLDLSNLSLGLNKLASYVLDSHNLLFFWFYCVRNKWENVNQNG